MKDIQSGLDAGTLPGSHDDYLHLYPVLGFDRAGHPVLAGVDPEMVVMLVGVPADVVGGFAACRPFGGDRIAVLGFLPRGGASGAGKDHDQDWLEIRHGKAAIRLCRDGRVRIEGDDILVNSEGAVALDGATVTLN